MSSISASFKIDLKEYFMMILLVKWETFGNFFHSLEVEGNKTVSGSFIKFGLELDPVETEGVKEGRETLHQNCRMDSVFMIC